jgi:anaerobic magnesium-protoporphyrin IX monomethyl ester cyclase
VLHNSPTQVSLINPNLVLQRDDIFTTGVVYMPVSLAYLAGELRRHSIDCRVIDAFGEKPKQFWEEGEFIYRGLTPEEVVNQVVGHEVAIFLYAINLTYHESLLKILAALKHRFPSIPVVILENTQAVTAYSLRRVQDEFFQRGADFVLTGEGEERARELLAALQEPVSERAKRLELIDGIGYISDGKIHYTPPTRKIKNLDELAFAAWDLFPIKNYWQLGYSHGPLSSGRYLPLLTSRGCPYPCGFCVIPETNEQKWRARSAHNVVDEIAHYKRTFGVTEFHIEDLDPTVKDSRTREIAEELIERRLDVTWKVCAGTKVETIKSEETLELMARSGCRYISISPESGSPEILKSMKKPFDIEHAIALIRKMNCVGIKSQACFVLGYPGEEEKDRAMTKEMLHRLVREGLDEVAIFIVTPVPGSRIFGQLSGYSSYSQLHFSPTWRQDYQLLNKWRVSLYRSFLVWKVMHHPLKIAKQCLNFIRRSFDTKMEMVPYRALHTFLMLRGIAGTKISYLQDERMAQTEECVR